MNFDALRTAPSDVPYDGSIGHDPYSLLRAHGRKLVIVTSLLAIPLLISGQIIGVVVVIIAWLAYRHSLRRRAELTIEQAQLRAFAYDNSWEFAPLTPSVRRTGSLFENGAPCMIENHLVAPTFEVGRCVFVRERDAAESVYKIRHFFGLYLPKALPHLLVNAKANRNGVFMKWFAQLDNDARRLSLEGDFDRHFTLYAPRKYDTDARVIFSPDVMRVLIREAKHYDMEIIGNRMYFYCDTIDWRNETFWRRIDTLAAIVEKEIGRQAIHYTDEHDGTELAVAQKGMGLHMIIDLPAWAKLWLGGITLALGILILIAIVFPQLY